MNPKYQTMSPGWFQTFLVVAITTLRAVYSQTTQTAFPPPSSPSTLLMQQARSIKMAIVQDSPPWGLHTTEAALGQISKAQGADYFIHPTANLTDVLSRDDMSIIWISSPVRSCGTMNATTQNVASMHHFVLRGGVLVVDLAENCDFGSSVAPGPDTSSHKVGGVSQGQYEDGPSKIAGGHTNNLLVTFPWSLADLNGTHLAHGFLDEMEYPLPPDASIVLTGRTGRPIMATYQIGAGYVLVDTITKEFGPRHGSEAGWNPGTIVIDNMLAWAFSMSEAVQRSKEEAVLNSSLASILISISGSLTVPVSSREGSNVAFGVSTVDAAGNTVPVKCKPESGSFFPLGTTNVTCTTENSNQHQNMVLASFPVTVVESDSTSIHFDLSVSSLIVNVSETSGAVWFYNITAADSSGGLVPAKCDHASGGMLPVGTITVTCTAQDASQPADTATAVFTVTVSPRTSDNVPADTIPPSILAPEHMVVEAASGDGASVYYTVVASDNTAGYVPVYCVPRSGQVFPIGTTMVTCTATDTAYPPNVGYTTFSVTVVDTTPPQFITQAAAVVSAWSGEGAAVEFLVSAIDRCSNIASISCRPPSGSWFSVGNTTVTCTAQDSAEPANTAHETFVVTVLPLMANDTTSPQMYAPKDLVEEATSGDGAEVYFTVVASDNLSGFVPVNCTPNSGHVFPMGTTMVICTASDNAKPPNVGLATFPVTVVDRTPPHIVAPGKLAVQALSGEGAVVQFPVTALDRCSSIQSIYCSPPSMSWFAVGSTSVTCTAIDTAQPPNTASTSFTVDVLPPKATDILPPQIYAPTSIVKEATSGDGAVVSFTVVASDNMAGFVPVNCMPNSGQVFPMGTTLVVCTASDNAEPPNIAIATFPVTIVDTTAPHIVTPGHLAVSASSEEGALVNFTVIAVDRCSNIAGISCDPPSGSLFAVGRTSVVCTASDTANPPNTAIASFTVEVLPQNLSGTTELQIYAPTSVVEEATSRDGAIVLFSVVASDNTAGYVPVNCVPRSGELFPMGTTIVTCIASDGTDPPHVASAAFPVTVQDQVPPRIEFPAFITAEAESAEGALVEYTVTAVDNCGISKVSCTPPSGSQFAIGKTIVTCTAEDAAVPANKAMASFEVLVSSQS